MMNWWLNLLLPLVGVNELKFDIFFSSHVSDEDSDGDEDTEETEKLSKVKPEKII